MYIKNVCILHVATVVKHTNGINHVFLLLHHMSIPFTFIYFRVHVGGVHDTYMYRGKERSFAKKEQEQHTLHVVRRILFVNSEIIILLVTMHINLFI